MKNSKLYAEPTADSTNLARAPITGHDLSRPTIASIIGVVQRRRGWVIGLIIAGILVGYIAGLVMKPVYDATATIELNKSGSGGMGLDFADMGGRAMSLGGDGLDIDLKTEVAVLKSGSVALAAIKQLGLTSQEPFIHPKFGVLDINKAIAGDAMARSYLVSVFQSHLQVTPVPGTRLIEVKFLSRNPEQAAVVANGVIDSYRNQYMQSHYSAVTEASDWLTRQLSDLKSNVEISEKALTDFEKSSGILTVPSESTGNMGGHDVIGQIHSPVIQKLDMLNSQLTLAEADRLQKQAVYKLTQSENADVIVGLKENPIAIGASIVSGSGGIANLEQLQRRLSDLKIEQVQGAAVFGSNNKHMKDVQARIDEANAQLTQEVKGIERRAAADLQIAQRTENALRTSFEEQQKAAAQLNEKSVQLAVLSQEAYSRKKLYEDLYTKLQEADISAGIKATNVTMIEPATPSSAPVRPRRRLYLGLGLALGAILGLGMGFAIESVDNTVTTTSEIEEITGSAVIGVIPQSDSIGGAKTAKQRRGRRALNAELTAQAQRDSKAWVLTQPNSAISESIKALRTSIFLSRAGGAPQVLLVTSSVPAEGKSTISSNLAITFAQHGQRVILVEADLRRPSLRHVLNIQADVGLSSVLSGTDSLDAAIVRAVNASGLDVLPAGPKPPMPSELLGSPAFDEVLKQLRGRYDMIIIDSPPALIVADAISIGTKADATIWVVRAGTATRPHMVRAAQLVNRGHLSSFIGFVLNGVDAKRDPYGYSYGYSYGGYKQYGAYYGADTSDES